MNYSQVLVYMYKVYSGNWENAKYLRSKYFLLCQTGV
jgi:hypothetical protein